MSAIATEPTSRRHDLDALRAIAMLLGIVLHAAIAYIPGAFWAVADSQSSPVFGILNSAIHGFRMPLFFLLSGFFTMMLYRKRGLASLLKHRALRILLPLVIGIFTILPVMKLVQSHVSSTSQEVAGSQSGEITDIRIAAAIGDLDSIKKLVKRGTPVDEPGMDGSTALMLAAIFGQADVFEWLRENGADVNGRNHNGDNVETMLNLDQGVTDWVAGLISIDSEFSEVEMGRQQIRSDLAQQNIKLVKTPPVSPAAKAVSGIWLALTAIPVWDHLWFLNFLVWLLVGFAALVAFSRVARIKRMPRRLTSSALAYAWLIPLTMIPTALMSQPGPRFGPDTSIGLIPLPHVLVYYAIFFFAGALYFDADDSTGKMGRWWMITVPICLLILFPIGMAVSDQASGVQKTVSLLVQSAYVWLMTFGLMGLFRRLLSRESRTMRYLSDSSYWLYVAHLPLVIYLQFLLRDQEFAAGRKFVIVCAVSTVILLASYHVFVRYTPIGTLLNGKRRRPSKPVVESSIR